MNNRKGTLRTRLRLWIGVLTAVILVGCAAPAPLERTTPPVELVPTAAPTPESAGFAPGATATAAPAPSPEHPVVLTGSTITYDPYGPTSVLEKIASSDVIVRAEVASVSAVVDSFSIIGLDGEPEPAVFARGLAYTLTVLEYLKGSGGSQVVAVVLDNARRYATKADADAATADHLATRDTRWENQEGLFFLWNWRTGRPVSTQQTDRYMLGSIRSAGGLDDLYTVDSRHDQRWLPAASPVGSSRSGGQQTPEPSYILTPGDDYTATSTIALADIKTKVSDIASEVADGDGTAEYERCVYEKYTELRRNDNRLTYLASRNIVSDPPRFEIESGLAEGARVNSQAINSRSSTSGSLEGDDADLFKVDPVGVVKTLRPLPAGQYGWVYLERYPWLEPCNAPIAESTKQRFSYFVDVVAPAGTDLEAFFDPVTVGSAALADDANGQLAPSSFGSTTISSISYESNEVTVTVDPVNGLSGHHLDFISLDGTLALSLEVSDAKKDNTDKTLTWPTTSDPWASGDTLMLRVYGATVDCSGATTFGSCDQGPNFSASRFTFTVPENTAPGETIGTVLATDPDSSDIVTHSLLSGNEAGHFTINASTGAITLASRLDYETDTSHKLRVMARSGSWGLALATVTVDVTDVDPDLVPAPTNLVVTEVADGFDATWDAVPGATTYDIQWKIDPHQYSDVFTDTTSAEIRPDGGVLCNTLYKFRVYAHGNGVDYDATWGEVPLPLYLRTAACAESPS